MDKQITDFFMGNEVANQNNSLEIIIPKRKSNNPKGLPIRVPWRFDSEGNLVVLNPTIHDYNKYNYATRYGVKVECEFCKRKVVQAKINRHHMSTICNKIKNNDLNKTCE